MLKVFAFSVAVSVTLFPWVCALSQPVPGITIEHHVAMKTRDGVSLYANIYRPAGEGNFPVLLQRTPYNRQNAADFGQTAAARGYMVVVQDVRGRYESEGEWYPFKHEIDDGFDTVEWAAGLPHANGKVGMFGGSYVGATKMLAAVGHPPHLAGICSVVTASNYHENWTYQGGAFEQWFNESWTSGLAQDTFNRAVRSGTNAMVGSAVLPLKQYPLFNMQLSSDPVSWTAKFAPYFLDWLDHPTYDSYWKPWAIEEQYPSIQVPALTVAAWYDIFQGGSLENYIGLKTQAGNAAARSGQRLIVIERGHAGNGPKIGGVDFGPDSHFDENATTLDWYDYLFQGKQSEFATEKVKLFVMGKNKWRSEDDWPLARAKESHYFLHSSGQADTSAGDGSLSTVVGGPDATDSFTYDPADPVPTAGGPLCCDPEHLPAGPRDQREWRKEEMLWFTPRPRSMRTQK